MKISLGFGVTVGLAVVGIALYGAYKGYSVVDKVATAINPVDPKNVFNVGANEVYSWLTGDTRGNIGTGVYDFFDAYSKRADEINEAHHKARDEGEEYGWAM